MEKRNYKTGRWTESEHELFLEALLIYGKDWDLIESHIKTRDAKNSRSHAQKFFFKLVKYLEGDEEIPEIQNAEKYLAILQKRVAKPNRKKKVVEAPSESEPEVVIPVAIV